MAIASRAYSLLPASPVLCAVGTSKSPSRNGKRADARPLGTEDTSSFAQPVRARERIAPPPITRTCSGLRACTQEGIPIASQIAVLNFGEYLELLLKSRLISETQLIPLAGRLPRPNEPSAVDRLSKALINADLLTLWQHQHLINGHWKGFFIGKHKLLAKIGVGGMGTVYLAEHTIMRRKVAIKVLPKANVGKSSYLERFLQEARAIASLDHPNIIRAYNIDNEGDLHYLVIEYVEGPNLDQLVAENGPLEFEEAADYLRQAAEGLAQAHDRGLIHRDVKPSNLLLDRTGVIKVLDMGLARLSNPGESSLTLEQGERVLGTADYLSPEQALDSHEIDHRSDLYSLGCTLYYLLTGSTPFPRGTLAQRLVAHQTETPPSPADLRPDTPPELAAICLRLLSKEPGDRYPTASTLAQVLSAWLAMRSRERRASRGPQNSTPFPDELALLISENETRCSSHSDTDIRWLTSELRSHQPPKLPTAPPVHPPIAALSPGQSGKGPAKAPSSKTSQPLAPMLLEVLNVDEELDAEDEGDSVDGFVAQMGSRYTPSMAYVARGKARNTLEFLVWLGASALVMALVGILLRR